ncbi:hypothetical protein FJY69_03565, partial [candidate division WOR-3 bacterium]|nr:hypothetical protein [candidate division WOR-3 bacterium]
MCDSGDELNMCVLLLLALLPAAAPAQVTFQRTYGGFADDDALSVRQLGDGGYILAGWTDSFGARIRDAWLIKTDSLGDTVWTRTFGGPDYDGARSVWQTRDGGYAITGFINGGGNAWFIKTDSLGDTAWTRSFGAAGRDDGRSVQQTNDGGYVIAGYTASHGAGDYDAWLIKTDSRGDTTWTRTFGGEWNDGATSAQQTADGGYVIVGVTDSYGAGSCDAWLIKTDSSGSVVWARTYGDTDGDLA